jgi:hypothetical protein
MNFMDYPWDPYKYMFTTDQATRMQTAMLNSPYRNQLGTHGLCSSALGLNDLNLNNAISIYPNPANAELNLNGTLNEIDKVSIRNLFGQVLIETKNQNSIDVSSLSNGVYIITITQGHLKQTRKFVKQ